MCAFVNAKQHYSEAFGCGRGPTPLSRIVREEVSAVRLTLGANILLCTAGIGIFLNFYLCNSQQQLDILMTVAHRYDNHSVDAKAQRVLG